MTVQVFTETPVLIGHRGLGKGVVHGHAENTMGSFLATLEQGIGWIEVDIRRTLDDELFVAHDAAFPDGSLLSEMTGEQVSGHGTLRIHELLEDLPADAGVVFDVKSSMEDAGRLPGSTTAALFAQLGQRALGHRPCVALSFDPAALRHMREQLPAMPLGFLTWLRFPIGQAVAAAAHLDVQLLAVHAGSFWPSAATAPVDVPSLQRVVTRVHDSNRQLMAWCPTLEQAGPLVMAGVDALVVDDVPQQVRAVSETTRQT